jgi:hypothetical protein
MNPIHKFFFISTFHLQIQYWLKAKGVSTKSLTPYALRLTPFVGLSERMAKAISFEGKSAKICVPIKFDENSFYPRDSQHLADSPPFLASPNPKAFPSKPNLK